MADLFAEVEQRNIASHWPLAVRMRPRSLEEFMGQSHFLGEGKLLRRMLLADRVQSVLFYGPPGTGKTTLAHLIARQTRSHFVELNAAGCGIKEVRAVLEDAKHRLAADEQRTILFLDEIHHFNKSQQDILLPDVESGSIVLIGATTQNPFFAINAPLVSRSQIFRFEKLGEGEVVELLRRALGDRERGFGSLSAEVDDEALVHLAQVADGDARRALTALEIAIRSFPAGSPVHLTRAVAEDSIQRKAIVHDATGDDHYDIVSAFIKSIRGSDPDAAIYWLARLLEGGDEPRFIARRLVILASEDIGCADPMSLLVATAAQSAVESVGLPECQLNLAQAVLHLATAPKSNSATRAIGKALKEVTTGRTLPVPPALRDAHYAGAARLGQGQGYLYPHDHPEGFVPQAYTTEPVHYYDPTTRGHEATIRNYLARIGKLHEG